jgi:hypothetical protein
VLEVPGSRIGLLAVAEGCKGHPWIMPMRYRAGVRAVLVRVVRATMTSQFSPTSSFAEAGCCGAPATCYPPCLREGSLPMVAALFLDLECTQICYKMQGKSALIAKML